MLSNFDKRQILLIKNQLLLLKQDKISIYRFVENLESLLNILDKSRSELDKQGLSILV